MGSVEPPVRQNAETFESGKPVQEIGKPISFRNVRVYPQGMG